jgi:hypothetical protein
MWKEEVVNSLSNSSFIYIYIYIYIYIHTHTYIHTRTYNNSVALVRERTTPTERPPLVGEVSANFSEQRDVA